MGVSYVKFCPRCQTTTAVDSALCPNCGYQFRTHFQPPASEKTIAMTSVPEGERPPLGPSPLQETLSDRRPILRPRLVLLGAIVLALFGLIYGALTRHSQQNAPVSRAAFQPYEVVIKSDSQGHPAPVATEAVADLQQWQATQPPQTNSDDPAVGDDPARVHLYFSKRIVLIPPGTSGRVLLEQGPWRRVQILDGLYRGTTGFISQDLVSRSSDLSPKAATAQASAR